MKINQLLYISIPLLITSGCSPLKSSPHEQTHQMELTIHELQTNLDDVQHDLNSYQSEQQILDRRMKQQENALTELKHQFLEVHLAKIENLHEQIKDLENKISSLENLHENAKLDIRKLSNHADDTTSALMQYKEKIHDLEKLSLSQNQRLKEIGKLKNTLDNLLLTLKGDFPQFDIYQVNTGDTLEKIAKMHQTHVDTLKQMNQLKTNKIHEGQKLKIPKNKK